MSNRHDSAFIKLFNEPPRDFALHWVRWREHGRDDHWSEIREGIESELTLCGLPKANTEYEFQKRVYFTFDIANNTHPPWSDNEVITTDGKKPVSGTLCSTPDIRMIAASENGYLLSVDCKGKTIVRHRSVMPNDQHGAWTEVELTWEREIVLPRQQQTLGVEVEAVEIGNLITTEPGPVARLTCPAPPSGEARAISGLRCCADWKGRSPTTF